MSDLPPSKDRKCDIIICVWNREEITRDCIESIYKNTRYPYRLILIDNASDDPTRRYLENVRDDPRFEVTLVRNIENLGNTKAVNQGIEASIAPYVCNLDNDTYVTEGWLTEMVRIAETDPAIGLVVPASNPAGTPRKPKADLIEACGSRIAKRRGEIIEMVTADLFCGMIKREVIDRIGKWDEIYSPGYFDDTDYCRRAIAAGFRIVGTRGAYVYHKEHGSFKKNEKRDALFDRNRKIYTERYGNTKRYCFLLNHPDSSVNEAGYQKAKDLAHRADWVYLWNQKGKNLLFERHSHLKRKTYKIFFRLRVFLRILFRRKKTFDVIYVTDPSLARFLRMFQGIHRSEINLMS